MDWLSYIRNYLNSDLWGFILLDYYWAEKKVGTMEGPSTFIDRLVSQLPTKEVDPVKFHNVLLSVCVQLLGNDFPVIMGKSINFIKDVEKALTQEQVEAILSHYDTYGQRPIFLERMGHASNSLMSMASKDLNRNIDEPNEKSSTIQNPVETGISLRDNVVPQAIELFFAYSRSDEKLRDKLETHLSLLKRQGLISTWYDRKIGPGREWESEGVSQHITSAQIILLLISADFIASDYCYGVEMTRAMERHEAREARVIPVILRPCDWSRAPFAKLQALPKDAVPVTKWKNRDEGFQDIAQGLRKAVEELTATLQAALALVLRTRPKTSASVQLQISQEELRGVESKPEKIGLERQYISELRKLPRGGGNSAREYQELVRLIFARVFDRSLSGIQLEETMYDGRKRIDIVATNSAAAGFFEGLSSKSHINCKFIPIECKNYSHSVSNPEFDQIGGRLYKKFGMFGFLVYRSAPDKKTVLKRCQDHLDKDEYILALDDDDLIALLGMRQGEKFDHIEDYLDNKFRALVTKKGKE